ncbi:MAG TPA: roadblock/LC7 domain-containing protein [Candidatus Nanopelagicaceae bacterium]|nr:roadblock/LC7 domain-containing protein [Candidatus Nanopelagicaceae bacterium]
MSSLEQDLRENMMKILKFEEDKTDLENLAVLSRVGMKVASASSSELDADATSASSTALIDLGLRLSEATAHGALKEIILHNTSGYSIILAINDEYLVFGGLKNVYRIGYYLGYIREIAKKLNRLISGDEITNMTLSLEDSEKAKLKIEEEEETGIIKPSIEEDKAALDDLLGFLDDWEKDGGDLEDIETEVQNNIVTIPKSVGLEYEKQLEKGVKSSETSLRSEEPFQVIDSRFKVYEDEIPPVPLEDYTPMEIEEDESIHEPQIVQGQPLQETIPSLEDLPLPDFNVDFGKTASEYDTEFVLDKESEAFESVLKDLGWDEEED